MKALPQHLINKTDSCWLWTGRTDRDGYGKCGDDLAHRRAYLLAGSDIPVGLELDHLCRVRHCVNPDHLEPVTHAENVRRQYADYNECVNGHSYTPENTYVRPSGWRDCRACIRARSAAYQARRRAA